MTRAPRPDETKSRLAAVLGDQAAADLAKAFLLDMAETLRGGPWHASLFVEPAEAVDELAALTGIEDVRPQAGSDLGARMFGALEALAADGYSPLIVTGSDIPTMGERHFRDALDVLGDSDVVFGPAEDGGYYRAGMHRPQPSLFGAGIEWGGAEVLAASERLAADAGLSLARLGMERDIDTVADLDWLRGEGGLPRNTAAALAGVAR
jgi:rSAM/selenodomain-associated transferase 1